MKKGRLLLPWGLLAGLLLLTVAVEGLTIKPVSVLKKPRISINNNQTSTTTSTTTTTTTEATELTAEGEEEEVGTSGADPETNVTSSNSLLTGDPQHDYKYDPNLPRELPPGYNLSAYPFFSRVPNDVTFECEDDMLDGYYANVHYKCQVYHHCLSGIRYDFLCANYTAFDQKTFICHFVSEVDCANSAKFWNRNKGLYETPTTSTVKPLTLAPPPPPPPAPVQRRPAAGAAGGGGRRRRPYRRRRPQYDYYYDDEYDEEYDEDFAAPAQNIGRSNRNRAQQRPGAADVVTPAPTEPPADDKPFKADSSIYDRPRQVPKVRRPVPANERDKYEYRKDAASGSEKKNKEDTNDRDYERPSRPRPKPRPSQDDDEYYDDEDYEQPRSSLRKNNNQDYYAPSGQDRDFARRPAMSGGGRPLRRNRPGARRRPSDEDDYDDRRHPTAPDVEPRRRPSDSEARRRPAVYDDDEPPRRRPTASEDSRRRPDDDSRRRPDDDTRRRPDDEPRRKGNDDESRRKGNDDESRRKGNDDEPRRKTNDDEPRRKGNDETRRRPDDEPRRKANVDDNIRRRPADFEEEPRRRPSASDDEPRRRPSDDEPRRRPTADEEPRRRPAEVEQKRRPTVSEEDSRSKSTSTEEIPRRRGTTEEPRRKPVETVEEDSRRKPATNTRSRTQQRDDRDSGSNRDAAKPQSNRDFSYDTTYNERASSKDTTPTGRDSVYERPLAASGSTRQGNRDNRDSSTRTAQKEVFVEKPVQDSSERTLASNERSRQERPSGSDNLRAASAPSGSGSLNMRPLTSRGQPTLGPDSELDLPIPAAKPAYISMLGREAYRKKVHDEETRLSVTGPGSTRVSVVKPVAVSKTTEAPKLYDDEYYYDDDEEIEEMAPTKPTSSGTSSVTLVSPNSQETSVKEELPVRKPLTGSSNVGTVSIVTLGPSKDVRSRGQNPELTRRIGPITESQARAGAVEGRVNLKPTDQGSGERVIPEEKIKGRPLDQSSGKKPSSIYHFNEDGVLLETSTRAGFRPRTTTQLPAVDTAQVQDYKTEQSVTPVTVEPVEDVHQRPIYQNTFRRKPNQADNTKVVPTKDLSGEVSIPPSGTGNNDMKPKVAEEFRSTEAPLRLETEIFELPKLKFESLPPSGPSGRGSIHYRKNVNDFPIRTPVLPDITDPEYDVTLNEAVVHPTRNPFSADGGTRIKVKVPTYSYRDAPLDFPVKKQGTLLSSASQTHISKAPFPVHEKYADMPREEYDYENTTGEEEYDDIPTGKGATKVRYDDVPIPTAKGGPQKYEWTTYPTDFRDSSIVSSRGTTGHQYVVSNTPRYYQPQQQQHQQVPQQHQQLVQQGPTRGPIREFTQTPFLSTVRNTNQQYYKPPPASVDGYKAQPVGVDTYRTGVNPLIFGQSYDYDLAPKYRPRRKYAPFFGKPY